MIEEYMTSTMKHYVADENEIEELKKPTNDITKELMQVLSKYPIRASVISFVTQEGEGRIIRNGDSFMVVRLAKAIIENEKYEGFQI